MSKSDTLVLMKQLESSGVIEVEADGRPAKSMYNIERTRGSSALQLDLETRTGRKHQVLLKALICS